VPFPVESALSGVGRRVSEQQALWYRRRWQLPAAWQGRDVLLHFGACDWQTDVWINGKHVGSHRGGYDGFSFDITKCLHPSGEQEIVVRVWDPTDIGTQPRGKQVRQPHGIWYTPSTGIWQTVWVEPVGKSSIAGLRLRPDVDRRELVVRVSVRPAADSRLRVRATALAEGSAVAQSSGPATDALVLKIPGAKLWSPASPFLYDLRISLIAPGPEGEQVLDEVQSYFGMRKIALGKDERGITRLFLNDQPLFQFGLLDQGFWPDGLYTAPSDEALRYDIEVTRQLGYNMCRKHVKVEPERWYYWCDRLGLLVWQDMPNGDAHVAPGKGEIQRSLESAQQFEKELQALIEGRGNHPCIVIWVPFNEGWGQYDTRRIVERVRQLDGSRLVNCASGWNDIPGVGDVHDIHVYPGPGAPPPEPGRAAVLGEFGGLGLPVRGHTWLDEKSWGYRTYKSQEELADAYEWLILQLRLLIPKGLSAAVYTQTTDVETEVNGIMTYDRAVIKIPADKLRRLHARVYGPAPNLRTLVPSSEKTPQTWRYTLQAPPHMWTLPDFDDRHWPTGQGGFGMRGTPGAIVRTEWPTKSIWLRRTFDLQNLPQSAALWIHHDEDAEVYINGVLAARLSGYTVNYTLARISPQALRSLRLGSNTLAVHCRQTTGGQYIDLGLVEIVEP